MWHRYPLSVNQVIITTEKLSKWWCQLRTLGSVVPSLAATLYQGILIRPQALEYHINREKYTTYAGAAWMLLHINLSVEIWKTKLPCYFKTC